MPPENTTQNNTNDQTATDAVQPVASPPQADEPMEQIEIADEKTSDELQEEQNELVPKQEEVKTPETVTQTPEPQIRTQIIYKTSPNLIQNLLIKARARIQERKREKLDKIMILFETKSQITNKDVQKLLRTTGRTARRYFDQLEAENRIKQVGNAGRGVFYEKIG